MVFPMCPLPDHDGSETFHSDCASSPRRARGGETRELGCRPAADHPLLDRKPGQLSGGQRQRVAIGRALVQQVKVFLFDEPLLNLDAKLRGEMRVEIKRLHMELQPTIVYVTHDQIEAMTLATPHRRDARRPDRAIRHPRSLYEKPETCSSPASSAAPR